MIIMEIINKSKLIYLYLRKKKLRQSEIVGQKSFIVFKTYEMNKLMWNNFIINSS